MKTIKCKLCKPKDTGCLRCGGYKVVLEQSTCPSCKNTHWTSPAKTRGMTVYDGKEWETFDGVLVSAKLDGNNTCSLCPVNNIRSITI